jgi:hypothetical protein
MRSKKSNLVINETSAEAETEQEEMICNQLQTVTFNASPPATVRHETMAGKNYLVVPMVMITEGVHAGSNGPLYYPAEELTKNCAVWDHKPIVVYHPTLNGQPISACKPHVISQQSVGLIMNTRYIPGKAGQPGKLKADAYLDESRLKKVDPRVYEAVQNKSMMEVSTGLFTDNEQKVGQWKKEQYSSIARNYKADHLAILPDQKGSCSIADGGGLMRNSEQVDNGGPGSGPHPADQASTKANELSEKANDATSLTDKARPDPEGDLKTAISAHMAAAKGHLQASEKQTMASQGALSPKPTGYAPLEGGLASVRGHRNAVEHHMSMANEHNASLAKMRGKTAPAPLQRPTLNKQSQTGVTMDREEVIDALIENSETIWDEGDRPWLTRCNLTQFDKLAANAGIHKEDNGLDYIDSGSNDGKNQPADAASLVKPGGAKGKKKVVKKDDEEETKDGASPDGKGVMNKEQLDEMPVEEFIANHVPAGMRDLFSSGIKAHNRAKAQLVKTITANKRCPWTPDELMGKPLPELEGLAALAGGEKTAPVRNNYYGLGEPGEQPTPVANQRPAPKPLGLPTFNFERTEK